MRNLDCFESSLRSDCRRLRPRPRADLGGDTIAAQRLDPQRLLQPKSLGGRQPLRLPLLRRIGHYRGSATTPAAVAAAAPSAAPTGTSPRCRRCGPCPGDERAAGAGEAAARDGAERGVQRLAAGPVASPGPAASAASPCRCILQACIHPA